METIGWDVSRVPETIGWDVSRVPETIDWDVSRRPDVANDVIGAKILDLLVSTPVFSFFFRDVGTEEKIEGFVF